MAGRKKDDDFDPKCWQDKYQSLEEYYQNEFDSKYYSFGKYELDIDPAETLEDFNNYSPEKQKIEYAKCVMSFAYFATKYIRILHPTGGLIPFVMYNYQRRVIENYDKHRFNIIKKFRQGGLTTLTELWGLWRCLFKLDQAIMLLSKTDREAIAAGEIINRAFQNLPDWMKPSAEGKWNDHHKQFLDTGSAIYLHTPEASRGRALTYLILDEAAFIPDMEKHWKAMYPTLSAGGNCIVISTVNGLGNWYEQTYHTAKDKKNFFNIIDLEYTEHPEYNNPKWVREQKAQLGEKGWLQEVLGSFLGSGETYISPKIIGELQVLTKNNYPKRKLFKKYINTDDLSINENDWEEDGAFWVWKEPLEGHEYLISVDCSEGVGDDGDNSCIEVFDNSTLEQVAEFYSNSTPVHVFSQIVNQIGVYYNHAQIIVENMFIGGSVLSNLQHDLFYDNIFYSENGKTPRPGIKVTPSNRSMILEAMQHRLMNGTIRINSSRFVRELNTFIFNPSTQKAQARKGFHDDAIMAVALLLYVRDTILRQIPMGADVPKELVSPFKTIVYEEIKKELMEGLDENLIETPQDPIFSTEDEMMTGVAISFRRKFENILREFSW